MEGIEIEQLTQADIEDTSLMLIYDGATFKKTTLENAREHIGVTVDSVTAKAEAKPAGATIEANVEITGTEQHKDFKFNFGIPKVNGIKSIDQTFKSTQDGNYNEVTVTLDNGDTSKIQIKNGDKGEPGQSGVTIPASGIFTMYVEDGHLKVQTSETTETETPFYIENGHLFYQI